MNDILFQIVLALLGIVVGIIVALVGKQAQKFLLLIFGLLLILVAGIWLGFGLATRPWLPTEPSPTVSPASSHPTAFVALPSTQIQVTAESTSTAISVMPQFSNPVQDVRVRQAIAYCTDRHALTQAAYPTLSSSQIDELVMDSFLRKSHWAYIQPKIQYQYNPSIGQSLLDQAGWVWNSGQSFRTNSQGKELSLTLTTTGLDLRKAWSSAFKLQMQACGINILTSYVDPNWLFGAGTGATVGDFELGGWYWDASDNPDVASNFACENIPTAQNGWKSGNWNRWCNPIASEAAKKASDTSLSRTDRMQYFATLQEEFAKDLPDLPLFFRSDANGWEHIEFNLSR